MKPPSHHPIKYAQKVSHMCRVNRRFLNKIKEKNIINRQPVCIGEVRASLQVVPNLGHQKFVVLMHLSF